MPPRGRPSAELLQLQQEWDVLLRAAGFVDAENRRNGMLRSWTGSAPEMDGPPPSGWGRLTNESSAQAKRDAGAYYRMAGRFLHDHEFVAGSDKAAWTLHAEGRSNRAISEQLAMSVSQVKRRLERLRAKMLGRKPSGWIRR